MKQRQKSKYDGNYSKLSAKDSSDEEETELFTRKSNFKEVPTVEISLDEDDTLQALSIRYRCSIEELKRLNNIHKDNEIYARRSLKVPYRPFTAALAGIHSSGKNSPEKSDLEDLTKIPVVTKEVLTKKLSSTFLTLPSTSAESEESDVNKVIFNSNLINSSRVPPHSNNKFNYKSASIVDNLDHDIPDEEVRLLPQEIPEPEVTVVSRYSCNGADGDISWIALIVVIVVLIFAVPIIYVLYIYEHPEQYHKNNQTLHE